MRHIKIITLITLSLFLATCNTTAQTGESHRTVNAEKFQLELNTIDNGQILDVRTPEEWEKGRIEDAILINWYKDDFAEKVEMKLDKTKPVFIYCASGNRSAKAMAKLNEMGFENLINLDGGIKAWNKAGNKMIQP